LQESAISIIFFDCYFDENPSDGSPEIILDEQMFRTIEIYSSSEDETVRIGAAVGRTLTAGDTILLTGELGAGKTRLAKGIISAATGTPVDDVVSPTFTLINRFGDDFPINHADLYRIDTNRLEDIDLEDVLEEGGALVVEWAEKIQDLFESPLEISIMYAERENERLIVVRWRDGGPWTRRIQQLRDQFPCVGAGSDQSGLEATSACVP
jgi:tRNA threonylcarbamoyladenosine biosynthesis protein TsaE